MLELDYAASLYSKEAKTMIDQLKSLLCLNSTLPKKTFFDSLASLPVIAADGAANTLIQHNIRCDWIVGDLDSFAGNKTLHTSPQTKIIHRPQQNKTDFEKTIQEMAQAQLFPTLVLGLQSGAIDHHLFNLYCLMHYGEKYPMLAYIPPQQTIGATWCIPIYSQLHYQAQRGDHVSFFPFPTATLSGSGLKWPLHHTTLSMPKQASIRNQIMQSPLTIQVHAGSVLMVHTEASSILKTSASNRPSP
jgi:thiamine pyrophosphokinase